jgi:hypothetical protein
MWIDPAGLLQFPIRRTRIESGGSQDWLTPTCTVQETTTKPVLSRYWDYLQQRVGCDDGLGRDLPR